MYLYTPNPDMLAEFNAARNGVRNPRCGYSPEYAFANTVCKSNLSMVICFVTRWEHTKFYSRVRRDTVPVGGVAFPREFFKETLIGESK